MQTAKPRDGMVVADDDLDGASARHGRVRFVRDVDSRTETPSRIHGLQHFFLGVPGFISVNGGRRREQSPSSCTFLRSCDHSGHIMVF